MMNIVFRNGYEQKLVCCSLIISEKGNQNKNKSVYYASNQIVHASQIVSDYEAESFIDVFTGCFACQRSDSVGRDSIYA